MEETREDVEGEFDEIRQNPENQYGYGETDYGVLRKTASIDDIVLGQIAEDSFVEDDNKASMMVQGSEASITQKSGIDERYERIELSCCWKFFQVFGALFYTMTMCFIVVGYQNIRDVMIKEGLFSDLCKGHDTNTTINGTIHFDHDMVGDSRPCDAQIYQLGLMFTLGITFLNLSTVFFGPLIDLLGPKIVGIFGGLEMSLGLFLFSLRIDFYIEAYIMISIGGVVCFLTVLHFQNYMHPNIVGFYNIFIMASEDTCAGVFLLVQVLYNHFGLKVRYQLWVFSILPLSFVFFSLICQPWKVYPRNMLRPRKIEDIERERQRNYEEIDLLLADDSEFIPDEEPTFWKKVIVICCFQKIFLNLICYEKIKSFTRNDVKNYVRYGTSEICCSLKFWIFFIYAVTGMPITYFYMVTFREQMVFIAQESGGTEEEDSPKIENMVYFLGILFIFVGIVTALPVGCLLSICDLKGGFLYIATLYLIVTIVSSIHVLDIQYIAMVAYIATRCCFYALWNQFGFVFAPNILVTFCSLIAFSASITNLSNYGFQTLARNRYTMFNVIFGGIFVSMNVLLAILSCIWVRKKKKREKEEKDEGEGVDEEIDEIEQKMREREEEEMNEFDGILDHQTVLSDREGKVRQQDVEVVKGLLSNLSALDQTNYEA